MGSAQRGSGALEFGVVLRQLRVQAALSLRELGRRALYDYTRLSRAENGEILIPADKVRLIDEVLHAGGLLVALRAGAADVGQAARGGAADGEPVTVGLRLPDGRLAGALDQPARVDGEVIGYLRQVLAAHYAADKMLGPRHLLRPVLAQIEIIGELRRGARALHAGPLLQILAQYAEMAGWLHQDAGNLAEATSWTMMAGQWAHDARDAQLAAYALVRRSNIACLAGDRQSAVQLAAAAASLPGAPRNPRLAALAAQQQARGHALGGEFRSCFTLLNRAAVILSSDPGDPEPGGPPYLGQYDLGVLQEQTAACHRAAGQAEIAISILEGKLSATPASLIRDRGHLTAKLAVAVVLGRQPDPSRAAQLGIAAIDAAQRTGSARIITELRLLASQLSDRWPDRPETRTLNEGLAATNSRN